MLKPAFLPRAFSLLLAVCLTTDQSRGNEVDLAVADAEQIIDYLHESRMRLQLLELRYETSIVQYEAAPTLRGCTCEYHAWFDFSEGRIRIDGNQHCPDHPDACFNSRFAYANQRFLVVDDDSLAGRELHGRGIEFIRDKQSLSVFRLSADPRLVGMLPEQLSSLKNYSTDDIIAIPRQSASQEVTEELVESESMKKLVVSECGAPHCTLTYWLSPEQGYMPARILCTAETKTGPLTSEVETQWMSLMDPSEPARVVWLPKASRTRQWDDGKLIIHETFTLNEAVIGRRPDDALFEWRAMNLPDGFVVTIREGKTSSTVQWDQAAQAFTEWKWKPAVLQEQPGDPLVPRAGDSGRSWKSGRFWMVIFNIGAGVGLVVYWVFRRRSV